MKSIIFVCFCLWVSVIALHAAPAIIPKPEFIQTNAGDFRLCASGSIAPHEASVRIYADQVSLESGNFLSCVLSLSTGYRFPVVPWVGSAPVDGGILLTTSNALASLGEEGYALTVTTNSVLVRAPQTAGIFYGVQTFLQLLPPEILSVTVVTNVSWTAPCVVVQDKPRFPWRGWMLDTGRHFFTVDEIKRMLDVMALHKLNVFHWHLSENVGFRMESVKYPLLTEIGAWRNSGVGWDLNPRASTAWNTQGRYGGFYSQAQIRAVVAYASQRHITIVPEIDVPGHSYAILAAYPELGPAGAEILSPATSMGFVQDILTEVMALFPGQYIHTGGDEVNGSSWLSNPPDIALMDQLHVTTASAYQHWFSGQIANFLQAHGRTMIGWTEIENGGILNNSACMDWLDSVSVAVANAGQKVVRTPTWACYLDYYEDPTATWSLEPPAIGGNVPLSTTYGFEPVPAGLSGQATHNILGAQGCTWTEYIASMRNVEFKTMPRLLALAEVTWTPAAGKNYADFTNRLASGLLRLSTLGINFNTGSQPQAGGWTPANTPSTYAARDWDITSIVTGPEVDVSFDYTSGANSLLIQWVALLENGIEIDRDTHAGTAGSTSSMASYVLRRPARKPGATYVVRASIKGSGGTDSTGIVYLPNWN